MKRKIARTASGTYIVGLFDISESYKEIKEAVTEIELEIKNLTDIELNGEKYYIEQYLGGDMKFHRNHASGIKFSMRMLQV
jgi:hypothetical protein